MSKNIETRDIGLAGIGFCGDTRLRKLRPALVGELAESMRRHGLLQPIVVCPSPSTGYQLIAGRHRLEAARRLKWPVIRAEIWHNLKDTDQILLAEIDENLTRVNSPPSSAPSISSSANSFTRRRTRKRSMEAIGRVINQVANLATRTTTASLRKPRQRQVIANGV